MPPRWDMLISAGLFLLPMAIGIVIAILLMLKNVMNVDTHILTVKWEAWGRCAVNRLRENGFALSL